jgi:hypothetical protein
MDRLQHRRDQIRVRNRVRYTADQEIMRTYHINTDLTRETTDEIVSALWDLKNSMDLPTEEIELAIASRQVK